MKRNIFLIIVFVIHTASVSAQMMSGSSIVPISPNAASLGRYGDVKPSLYTGEISVSVPIYVINLDGKDIPISLSYKSNGVKVSQEASWVGLSWALDAGGMVVREVKGTDDFKGGGYFWDDETPWNYDNGTGDKLTYDNLDNYRNYFTGIKDPEPDVFNFNFVALSGKMFFEKNKTTQGPGLIAKPIIHSADQPADISYHTGTGKWVVRDGQGYTYYFGTEEETEKSEENSSTFRGVSGGRTGGMVNRDGRVTTAWLLDSIESPKKNKIYFHYKQEWIFTPVQTAEEGAVLDEVILVGSGIPENLIINYNYSFSKIKQSLLSSIVFKEGSIEFKTTDREDIELANISGESNKSQKLSKMEVRNLSGDLIKEVNLNYKYLGSAGLDGRLLLESVAENNLGKISKHTFTYNEMALPPKYSLSTDAWGYYNGAYTSLDVNTFKVIPSILKPSGVLVRGGADKTFNTLYASAGLLQKVVYPTGGSSEFTYEPHVFDNQEVVDLKLHVKGFVDNYVGGTVGAVMNQEMIGPEFDIEGIITEILISAGHDNPFPEDPYPGNPTPSPSVYYGIRLQKWNGTWFETVASQNIKVGKDQPRDLDLVLDGLKPLPGRYRLAIMVNSNELEPQVYVWTSLKYKEVATSQVDQIGGGLRVATVKNRPTADKEEIKEYKYSAATLMSPLDYSLKVLIYGFAGQYPHSSTLSYYLCRSFPYTPFSSTGRGSLGYSSVTEISGEGSTTYNFVNNVDARFNNSFFPGLPTVPYFNNGLITSMVIKDKEGKPVQKENYTYSEENQKTIYGVKFFTGNPITNSESIYSAASYPLEIQNWRKEQKTITTYTGIDSPITQTSRYGYDSFLQENSVNFINGDGKKITKITKYPKDYTDAVSNSMCSAYMVGVPIESISLVNEKVVSARKIVFKENQSIILPYTVSSFVSEKPIVLGTHYNHYQLDYTFNRYDSKGNLLELLANSGMYTSFLWDTKSLFPIAMIENRKYTDVIPVFSGYNMTGTGLPDIAEETLIRTRLPGSKVKTYKYKLLEGLKSTTDVRGVTEYYSYDGLQRLQHVFDQFHQLRRSYDYHLKP